VTPETLERLRAVIDLPDDPPVERGFVDLAGETQPPGGIAQALMETRLVPRIYERWWRPGLARIAKGPRGPSMAGELAAATRLLRLTPGDVVLDVACGPGNFTRHFAEQVDRDGLVVGIDLSETMLARAVEATVAEQVVYVRGDVTRLSLREGRVDAACCFAALHLFDDPDAALDAMVAALRPGGRIAILTSARPAGPLGTVVSGAARATGMRMFGRDEIADALAQRGLTLDHHETFGAVQLTAATTPTPSVSDSDA
jgi:SAM-dependent methyltransferase